MAQLDKFKRRLIRSVARLRVDEKRPDQEVWEILNKEMGCDCGTLWDRMRALTVKKLGRLLVGADRAEAIASVARPSDTDLLMFDLVLAHEDDVDVIGREALKWAAEKSTDCKALEDLFDLVQEFSLEETPPAKLAETWEEAVRYYEQKGERLTSPMLLQRRWYQLKELTRANFYRVWQNYRGHALQWTKARTESSLTDLQVAIAERYPYIITKEFPKWDELVKAGQVVLPHLFEKKAPEKSDSGSTSGNDQDLVILEPEVETIDLRLDSDSDPVDSTALSRPDNTAAAIEFDPNITIKTEPPDLDGLSCVKILEATHIPIEKLGNTRQDTIKTEDIDPRIALKNDLLRNITKCIESTDELIKQCDPQEDQSENVQNALNDIEHQMEDIIGPRSPVETIHDQPELEDKPQTAKDNKDKLIEGKAMDYFRDKIVNEMSKSNVYEEATGNAAQNRMRNDNAHYKSNVPVDIIDDALSPEKHNNADVLRSSDEEEVLDDIIKQTADDFVNKSTKNRAELSALTLTDFTIVDEGIAFVDDGIECDNDEEKEIKIEADNGSSVESVKQDGATPSIDPKLLMAPVVLTTRLDDMLAFKDKKFECVVNKSTIDFAALESKPKLTLKEPVIVKKENKTDADDSDSEGSIEDNISEYQRIKSTSYLLQKPKSRSYNPIQLCKNPDFNTRLKRLTFGFLSSERNRQFLSACKPATIDLHKAFEDKLVNGTLYLKRTMRTDFVKESSIQKDDQSVRTVSVVPSAMSVQSLIDRSKVYFQPPSAVSSIDLTSEDMTERNKIIHLPDITQVRRINQKLLTAEVPPIRVQNNASSWQAPPLVSLETTSEAHRHIEAQPAAENRVEITDSVEEDAGVAQELNDSKLTNHVLDKNNTPLLSNLMVTHKPSSLPKNYTKNAHLNIENFSPASKVSTTQNISEKQVDKPLANPDKPPRKQCTRSIVPNITWSKPILHNFGPLDDFLIQHDTLLKMLAKAKNQPEFTYNLGNKNSAKINKKSKQIVISAKKKQKVTKNKEIIQNQKSIQEENINLKVIETQKESKNNKNINTQKSKVRKGFTKTICCWARALVLKNEGQLIRLPRHMCPFPECNCCCKDELSGSKPKEIVLNNDPIELSDEDNDSNLASVSKIIESVVQQSIQIPVPKLRVFSTDKPMQYINKEPTNFPLGSTEENTSLNNIVAESVLNGSEIENNIVGIALHDVTDDDSGPVANVQGEISQIPVPKLRVFSTDKPMQYINKEPTNFPLGSTEENTSLNNIVAESVLNGSEIENNIVGIALHDVTDDDSGPVANVQGEISVVTNDTIINNAVNVELSTEKRKRKKIFVIPEASYAQMNESNLGSKVESNAQVFSKEISTQNHFVCRPIPSLISPSNSKKMYVKALYTKPSQMPPSVSMSTQTMDVPLLQNLTLEPDIVNQKQLVIDGTRPLTIPRPTLVNKKDQVIYLRASKVSPENPIYLGKNKILLTTVKFPSNLEASKIDQERKEKTVNPKVFPTFPLPEGVEIVLQPNGELACMVKPGIELDHTQISILPTILEAVKQQINTQQPFLISDVINLSDDENEQKNENTGETSQKNNQKEVTSPGEQLVNIDEKLTNDIKSQKNCEEQLKQSGLLIQQENITGLSEVCTVSSESQTKESETVNLSHNQMSNQEETNICQVQDGDTLQSKIYDDNLARSDKNGDEDQQDKTKFKNNKCDDDRLNEKDTTKIDIQNDNGRTTELDTSEIENCSKKTEPESKETQENNERSVGSRNLLSDLMEMSGISEEDIKVAPDTSIPTLPAVINIDLDNIAHKMDSDASVTNPFPDLAPVTSIAQLKYACEQNGKFFKLDFESGNLVPISVCIKKKNCPFKLQSDSVEFAVKETGLADKVGIPANPKVGIPAYQKVDIHANPKDVSATSTIFRRERQPILISRFGRKKRDPVFSKPINILRHTRPQSLLRNQLQSNTRTFKRQKKKTAARIEAKIDLVDSDAPMEEEYLINSESDDDDMASKSNVPANKIGYKRYANNNTVTEISEDSSDDEPLALKSKRMRSNDVSVPTQAVTESLSNFDEEHEENIREFLRFKRNQHLVNEDVDTEVPISILRMPEPEPTNLDNMELDTDLPTAAILEEPMPEPDEGDSVESESSPEDSILGM